MTRESERRDEYALHITLFPFFYSLTLFLLLLYLLINVNYFF